MKNNNTYVQTLFMINHNEIRNLCIAYNFCTKCDNNEYYDFLQSCDCKTHDFYQLKQTIYNIANAIHKFNNDECEYTIENIMYIIMHECVHTFFELIENNEQ